MDALVILIPLLPFLAALIIGGGQLFGRLQGARSEQITADLATWAITLAFLMALALLIGDGLGLTRGQFSVGRWLNSDTLNIRINFISSGLHLHLATLFSLLLAIISQFAIRHLHGEAGFHRWFFSLSLFAAAMLLMLLSANMVGTFIGWEIASFCAYLLIGYRYQQLSATENALRVLVTHRLGDVGFIIGISLSYAWLDSVNWQTLYSAGEPLSVGQATGMSLCFLLAAAVKSAQLPFTPWLARAAEAPTPANAVVAGGIFSHAGVFLLLLLQPIISQSPFALVILGLIGFSTTLYSYIVGLSQTDLKTSLVFASSGQIGLMFLECALGFWELAQWHLCAHAVVRCQQYLSAPRYSKPSLVNSKNPVSPWLFMLSLQRGWLEQITDWALVKPIRGLALDLSYFDAHIIDRIMGIPALKHLSLLAQQEEHRLGASLDNDSNQFAHGTGVAGRLTQWAAAIMHWFEDRFVLRGVSNFARRYGRDLGHIATQFEQLFLRPRYLVLFVCITFLIAF